MYKIIVSFLIVFLSIGTTLALSKTTESNFETQSSQTPSNFIDHLPFTIDTTGAYYIAKDLTVNGNGITILAHNAILIGQGHTITGSGNGIGINITADNVAIVNCNIKNFSTGTYIRQGSGNIIVDSKIYNNTWRAIFVDVLAFDNVVKQNMIINNPFGVVVNGYSNRFYSNYFSNTNKNAAQSDTNYWNTTCTSGTNIVDGPCIGGNYWHDYTGIDTNGDGLGNTDLPYNCHEYISPGGDYLPLVDIISPKYDLKAFNQSSPSTSLSITWKDNVQLDKTILQLDGANYTNSAKVSESFGFNEYYQVEHKVTYASFFVLPVGPHTYRWYANDTSNHWNSTQLQSFSVVQTNINSVDISSILKVSANITCQGATNITEEMDTVDLQFNIDGTWYSKAMAYSPSTKLYSALIPEYNQLANKTILIYVAAKTKQNQFLNSDIYIYHVPQWVQADLNRDGKVTILDIVKATSQYGQPYP